MYHTVTKNVIFLIVAFIIVIGLTFAFKGSMSPMSNTGSVSPTTSSSTISKTYTLADVAKHAVKTDCWTAVHGNVYNLTSFIPSHPGGDRILVVCGKDGTAAFEGQHDNQPNPNMALASFKIGTLAK